MCSEVRTEVADVTFHAWIAPLELAGVFEETLFVRAPRENRGWVEERYAGVLARAASRALGTDARVAVVGPEWVGAATAASGGLTGAPPDPEAAAAGVFEPDRRGRGLNPKYTFDQFVICEQNHLAHAAALSAAELPGQAYNPLFIHGPPGLGKTHLLHAIGNYVQAYGSGSRVEYTTVDAFTTAFVAAVRGEGADGFRERFRGADVLLVDDVQFLPGKTATMEELFHTFNALYESGRQIVLTSDCPPAELGAVETRLAERFKCGLVAELSPPGHEVRLAILRKRAALDAVGDIGDETLSEIAVRAPTSVRSLEGALIRVVAYASLKGEHPTPELARRVLARFEGETGGSCTIERIQQATAEEFGIDRGALVAPDRRPQVAFPRQIAMYLSRELTGESLPAIGAGFGGRNHTTVLHACRRIEQDERAHHAVDRLRRKLGVPA